MKTKSETLLPDSVNVLLVGNNPIELSRILDSLKKVPGKKIITEIAFDLKSICERLIRFEPNFILIDDNVGKAELQETVKTLSANKKTQDVPITVLKNSNYTEALGASSILDYLLKKDLSAESIYIALKNSIKLRRTQLYLYQAYQRRKQELMKIIP